MLPISHPGAAGGLLLQLAVLATVLAIGQIAQAGQKRLYIACDDHTDYFWTADPATYRKAFIETLDYYLACIDAASDQSIDTLPANWMQTYRLIVRSQ